MPQADQRARTFPVSIRVLNEVSQAGPLIQAGMYARAALPVGKSQVAKLVPKDAIVLGGINPTVYAVTGATGVGDLGNVRSVTVELGVAHGTWIQVQGNIKAGEFVVVQGNERLQPDAQVKLLEVVAESPPEQTSGHSRNETEK